MIMPIKASSSFRPWWSSYQVCLDWFAVMIVAVYVLATISIINHFSTILSQDGAIPAPKNQKREAVVDAQKSKPAIPAPATPSKPKK